MNTYLLLSIAFFLISIFTANYRTKHFYSSLFNTLFIFLYLFITIIYLSADYFTGKGITQAVVFTLETGLQNAGFGEYRLLITIVFILFLFLIIFSYFYFRFIKYQEHLKAKYLRGIIHNICLITAFLTHPLNLDIYNVYTSMHVKQSTDFYQYYKKPNLDTVQRKDYNLIYIYAESLEKTYFDESIFPGLMENLKELKKTSTEFTNINQVVGTGWTIGGMTATQCAVPLFTTSQGNSMNGSDTFLSGTSCLGDILKFKDYHLTFMQGSSVDFSGLRSLYETHKFDEVYGYKELKQEMDEREYENGWGLYDDTLFPMVYQKFEELSKKNDPFALFMATIDTHHPNGMTSKYCSDIPYKKGENSILNAVHCSDTLISQFIKKIQNSKYSENTLIVLTSDHLAMRNTATDTLKKKKRKNLFLIFDPLQKQYITISKTGSMLDIGPTVLSKLGIKTDFGLGKNLLKEESLFSSFKDLNKKLLSWREEILKFWQFAILGRHYTIDKINKKIHIGLQSYKIPILVKIKNDETIRPIFEFNSPKDLNEYFLKFDPKQKFIWVDQCNKINYLFDLNFTAKLCTLQGSLSNPKIEAVSLKDKVTTVNTMHFFKNINYNTDIYNQRINKLKELFTCRSPLSINHLAILSSRLPTFISIPSAIATPNHFFPISQKMNVLTKEKNGEYKIEEFDINSGKIAANKFLKTIKNLILEKKFWAIVAQHNIISNTYPEYNNNLKELGFKLLPTLNFNVSYIAYMDENESIHEYVDKESRCKVIPSFIK